MDLLHVSNLYLTIGMLVVMTLIINKASDVLGEQLSIFGIKLKIPNSVRGATFDAVSSSIPELITALVAVLIHGRFEDIGFATIAGSGIFNILLIPMLALLFYKGSTSIISIEKSGVYRDAIYYLVALGILFVSIYFGSLNWLTGIFLLLWYGVYVYQLYKETKKHRESLETSENDDTKYTKLIITSIICLIVIWFAIDSIIFSAITISNALNIPQYIISLLILAGCTSIPDLLLSVKSSKKGDLEGSVANAVGSNIFDATVCLGVPLIIAGSIPISLDENISLFFFLFLSMLVTAFVLLRKNLKKQYALIMAITYSIFISFIIIKSIRYF